jgi:pimeloyl-ACP methyl ester carboxylesterase
MMIFIHGAGLNASIWDHQMQAFPEAYFPTLKRTPTDHPSVHDFTEYIASYIEDKGIEPTILIGHSLGGGIALDCALLHPHIVKALVLVSASPQFRVPQKLLDLILTDLDAFIQTIMDMGFHGDVSSEAKNQFNQAMKSTGAQSVYHDYRCANGFDIEDRIHEITIPTLILAPAEDHMLPLVIPTSLSEKIKGSSLHIIEGAGHMVILEKPDVVNTKIASFIDQVE